MLSAAWLADQFPALTEIAECTHGGQKWVFSALHEHDGDVVIKLIKPTTDVQRVQREVLAVTRVNSARVPPIFDQGTLVGTPSGDLIWLRERRIAGESLRAVLAKRVLAAPEILQLALHVLEALADVAQARIVHRDVKPDNIMRDVNGSYWLLDFGIARHLGLSSLTATAALAGPGTLGYAPPEQFRNRKRDLDERADLFALAVTLVESLTGRHPYRDGARDAPDVIRRMEERPLEVPTINWDRSSQLFDLITAMGQRRANCRPKCAAHALAWMRDIVSRFAEASR